jgi:transcriptional regulator with XRE-family HTH domain
MSLHFVKQDPALPGSVGRVSFQTNLRPIREREGFGTQKALAAASGVSLKSIADYERGQAEPTLSKLLRLADALACGLDELVGRPTPAPRVIVDGVRYVPADTANGAPGSDVAAAASVLDPAASPERKPPRHSR